MRNTPIVITLLLAIICGVTPWAAARRPSRSELAQQIALAVQFNQEAEGKLLKQMQIVASWAREFRRRSGHYPASPQEIEFFQRRLGDILPPNPYAPPPPPPEKDEPLLAACTNLLDPPRPAALRIKVIIDPGLTARILDESRVSAPDSWSDSVGNITVISNGADLCAVWAGSCNGRPVRDQNNGNIIYSVAR